MSKLFFVGELVADMVERGAGSGIFDFKFGGCSYFGAKAAARAISEAEGLQEVHYIGPISRDTFGDRFLTELTQSNVNVGTVVPTERLTTQALVAFHPGKENAFSFYSSGTTVSDVKANEIVFDKSESGERRVFVYGSISTTLPGARDVILNHAREARDHGLIYFDLNARPSVISQLSDYPSLVDQWAGTADIVKASDYDILSAYPGKSAREVAQRWISHGAHLAIVTFGDRGSWAMSRDGREYVLGTSPLAAAYSVGAGDSFNAGVGIGLLQQCSREELRGQAPNEELVVRILDSGNKVAARHLLVNGATPSIPRAESVELNLEVGIPVPVRQAAGHRLSP